MYTIAFEVELLSDVLASGLDGDPNSAVSVAYIPGSLIRGAVVAEYLRRYSDCDLECGQGRDLFLNGDTRFLNAYPKAPTGRRSMPTPLSLCGIKDKMTDDGSPIWDRAVGDKEGSDIVGYKPGFCDVDAQSLTRCPASYQISVHIQRDPAAGRATRASGSVFRYQALASGQVLVSGVLTTTEAYHSTLKGLMDAKEVWLGRSRSANYGHARITVLTTSDELEPPPPKHGAAQGSAFRIVLQSAALLRNNAGAWQTVLQPRDLGPALEHSVELSKTFAATENVAGYNRKWGLPLPQAQAIAAGSVFGFQVVRNIPQAALRELAERGIGLRRAEGFGRLAIDPNTEPVLLVHDPSAHKPCDSDDADDADDTNNEEHPPLGERETEMARRMLKRLTVQWLDRQLLGYVNGIAFAARGMRRTQMNRLRSIALDALPARDVGRVRDFLDDLKPTAKGQFEGARIGGGTLITWLNDRLDEKHWTEADKDSKGLFELLDVTDRDKRSIAGLTQAFTGELAKEYTLKLIAEVMHRAAKERRAKEGGSDE